MSVKHVVILLLILLPTFLIGQNGHFSFGIKNNGICFGNSNKYNGVRLNLIDNNVDKVNGLSFNVAGLAFNKRVNGISFGLIGTTDSLMNGLQFGSIYTFSTKINGISITPFLLASEINGLQIVGVAAFVDTTNGVLISLFGTTPFDMIGSKIINGLAIGGVVINSEKVNGVIISGILCAADELNGVSFSCFNLTKSLHGFQFGLINYAANNRKLFRVMPFMNFNLKKK